MKAKVKCNNLKCNNHFVPKGVGTSREKKFCSTRCQVLFNSNKRYQRLKDDPEYKKKAKETFNKWRKKNREHFNDLVREPARIFMNKRYHIRKSKRLCVYCGEVKARSDKVTCQKCGEARNKARNKWKNNDRR